MIPSRYGTPDALFFLVSLKRMRRAVKGRREFRSADGSRGEVFMRVGERVWDTFTTVVQMKDRIAALTDAIKGQQSKIEDLAGRVIRLETALAMLLQGSESKRLAKR